MSAAKPDRTAEDGPIPHRSGVAPAAAADTARAWLIAGAAFAASFVTFGVIYSFGVFLRPITTAFHADAAAGSAFFSITAVVYYGLGAVAGRLADRCEPRIIIMAGAVILGLGLCLTAMAGHIWSAYLSYGLGVGVGGACCYVPTLSLVGGWFVRHRNAALGIAASGTGGGTMAVPPLAALLIRDYGWRRGGRTAGGAPVAHAHIRSGVPLLGCGDGGAVRAVRVSSGICPRPWRRRGRRRRPPLADRRDQHPRPPPAGPARQPARGAAVVQGDGPDDGAELCDLAVLVFLCLAGGVCGGPRDRLWQPHRGNAGGADRIFRDRGSRNDARRVLHRHRPCRADRAAPGRARGGSRRHPPRRRPVCAGGGSAWLSRRRSVARAGRAQGGRMSRPRRSAMTAPASGPISERRPRRSGQGELSRSLPSRAMCVTGSTWPCRCTAPDFRRRFCLRQAAMA